MDDETLWQPKPGDLVRLKKPKNPDKAETARIEVVGLNFGNETDKSAVMLDGKLDGFRYWNRDDLEPVRTRVTLQLPVEAVEKILENEDEFLRFLRANDIPVERLVNIEINGVTVFNEEGEGGERNG